MAAGFNKLLAVGNIINLTILECKYIYTHF